MNWQQFTYLFKATSSTTTLGFFNGDPGFDNSNGLDNIVVNSVSTIPELATWAMMIIGFGGVAMQIRRRRHTVALTG